MGEVYRASDTKLGRDVALKVLPAEMAQDPDRLARFRREAKTLAQLDHPNIVTIYSVEECDGVHFLTMQLVEGQALDRLICAGGMAVEQIVGIAGALSDALAAAHEKGIVHRDLKPANVMVSKEGRVKVLDFGLAKDIRAAELSDATMTSDSRTQIGVVMGTPAYMSPEQTSGRPLDHRTDIFSLGVLLHEMSTGRRPFEGTSSAELVSSILRDTPASVTDVRPELPGDLARIVRRCLEKDPRHRLQTARDVSNEFRDLARTTSGQKSISTGAPRMAPPPDSGTTRADEGFWVAVLPFKYAGSNADLTSLADGLSDDILTGLSKFSYLRVIARSSTARYAHQAVDVRGVARDLGARYVMEGSIRQAGAKVRIAAQLVDATSGASLWAETYDRPFQAEAILELLDEIVPRIVSTVADTQGVLAHSMTDALRHRDPETLTPYEAVLRSFGHHQRINVTEHLAARTALEHAVTQPPDRADCWAVLAWLYREEFTHGFNLLPDPLGRALAASRRALDAGPSNHLAHAALASTLFFQHDVPGFRGAAERAIALNPLEGYTLAYLGMLIAYSGDWERGCALADRAMQLNPNHPGWYWFPRALDAYRQRDYRGALETALKVNMPGFWRTQLILAAANGQLGERAAADNAVQELLRIRPNFAVAAPGELRKWHDEELQGHLIEGLRKAGLEIPQAGASASQKSSEQPTSLALRTGTVPDSGAARADVRDDVRENEGFWVAVLPFKYAGPSADLKALADGLSEEIVTGLSRFSYLRVIARGSTAKYSRESSDLRTMGKELGARYVMEGSVHQAGAKLRLAVQLVDAVSNAQMWAETYERTFAAEAIFELQDELVLLIVSTVADQHGVLPHSLSNLIRNKPDDQLSPYEALLRVFSFHERMSPEEHAGVRALLERTVQTAPSEGECWAMLATLYADEYMFGFSGEPDPLGRAQKAAQRAIELAPSSSLAHQALAQSLFFRREWQAFRPIAERTVALNRADGALNAFIGMLIALAGEWERGCALVDAAIRLNPHHPGWYWCTSVFNAYRQRDYRASAGVALRIHMPGYFWGPATSAAAFGQLGEHTQAQKALKELLVIRPDFARAAREEFGKWFDDELTEHYVEGLHKAGLQIVDRAEASAALKGTDSGATHAAVREPEGFWVAVLPFKYAGASAELKALADGLSEEIVTGLSRFSYLRVIARGSTTKYSGESGDVRTIGKELGARYVMEGSLRQAGTKLRLAVQLVDALSGAHLWAENYERAFSPDAVFELQDDLVPRIVSTVADMNGALPRSMAEAVRNQAPDQLSPYEAVLRSFAYFERYTPQELSAARAGLEAAVRKSPAYADAWAMLSYLCAQDYVQGYELQAHALDHAASAARRAVELSPANPLAYFSLAQVLSYQKDFDSFRDAAERALALNPMDGNSVSLLGELLTYAGDAERGMQLAERAKRLNPNHPGTYWYPDFYHAFSLGDYRGALAFGLKCKLRGNPLAPMFIATAAGHLGERDTAAKAVAELLKFRPELPALLRKQVTKVWNAEYGERFLEGLRKAGLEIPEAVEGAGKKIASAPGRTQEQPDSSAARADIGGGEGFWVAVLPFKYTGGDAALKALAEGLSEEVITGLSRFSYLRVIARGPAAKHSGESGDIRAIGKELGARYLMEGSLRQAGTKLRLAVQLVDAASGTHLWAESYERTFSPEAIFELQDELVPRIVSTVADMNGMLPRSMSEAVRSHEPEELSPYEAVLRSFGYFERVTPEDLAAARSGLEAAVRKAPTYGDAWAMLALLHVQDYAQGFGVQADALTRGTNAARRAVAAAPSSPLAHFSLAQALFFEREFPSFRNAAERAVELNPMDGNSLALLAEFFTYSGDAERGLALAGRAKQLNPNHPGWYWHVNFNDAYRRGDYRGALNLILKSNMTENWGRHALMAAACGQLGEREAASKALQELRRLRPDIGKTIRREAVKWFDAEHGAHLMDGWRKAGLEIAPNEEAGVRALDESHSSAKATSAAARADIRGDEGFWVAVLPFRGASGDAVLEALADGLTEDITTGLSRFPYLLVIAHNSAMVYKGRAADIRTVGRALGARYVVEGSLRRRGRALRVSAQLMDALSGTQLWADAYDRELIDSQGSDAGTFEVQDDLTDHIVTTVADGYGVLVRSMAAPIRERNVEELSASELVLRHYAFLQQFSPQEHAVLRAGLERALEREPNHAPAWACLSGLYQLEYYDRFNPREKPLERAREAAWKAVKIDPACQMGWKELATVQFFSRDFTAFRETAERALALNPRDGTTLAYMALMMAFSGDWERGVALAQRAIELNRHHPGWNHLIFFHHHYRKRDYEAALQAAKKINMPEFHWSHLTAAAACGMLGRHEEARASIASVRKYSPTFLDLRNVREDIRMWDPDNEEVEHLLQGLQKVGLKYGSADSAAT
jgi:TolB-like protein/Tfp pilus assembly protein PilF